MSKTASNHLSDNETISLILSKNQQGIEILYNKYGNYVFGFIVQIVKRDDLAELVLQDTFLKVWYNIESFNQKKGILITWIVRIARNSSIDMMRSKSYKKNIRLLSLDDISADREPISNNSNIDYLDLKDTVAKLDRKCSIILELIYFEGYTSKEIAEELDIPLGTVKSRIRKGLKDLRKIVTY